jgi:hypothetical protein
VLQERFIYLSILSIEYITKSLSYEEAIKDSQPKNGGKSKRRFVRQSVQKLIFSGFINICGIEQFFICNLM